MRGATASLAGGCLASPRPPSRRRRRRAASFGSHEPPRARVSRVSRRHHQRPGCPSEGGASRLGGGNADADEADASDARTRCARRRRPRARDIHRTPPRDARSSSCPSMDGTAATWTLDPSSGAMAPRRGSRPPTDPRRGGASYLPATRRGVRRDAARAPPRRRRASHRRSRASPSTRLVANPRVEPHRMGAAVAVLPRDVTRRTRTTRRTTVTTTVTTSAPRATSCARGVTSGTEPVRRSIRRRSNIHGDISRCSDVRPAVLRRRGRNRAGVERSHTGEVAGSNPSGGRGARGPRGDRSRCPRCDAQRPKPRTSGAKPAHTRPPRARRRARRRGTDPAEDGSW